MTTPAYADLKAREWRHRLLAAVSGLLVFETLTGLFILLLPFSVTTQVMVLLHTGIGLVFAAPYLWYQLRHWRIYRSIRLSHEVLTGYFAMAAAAVLVVTGLVLTVQAMFGRRIGYGWDLAHNVATFALILAVLPHLGSLLLRARRGRAEESSRLLLPAMRRWGIVTAGLTAALFALVGVARLSYRPVELATAFPADYSYVYGPERPFAPSLARTASGGAYDARSMAGSATCGTAGCHKEIYDEWAVSAHRYSAMDAAFQKVQEVMGEQNGPESTRYCGGCHDPISLFSGTKNIFTEDLTGLAGYQEGVSCISCHSIREADVKGNAAYLIEPPERYLYELADSGTGTQIRNFLLRAYPRHHVRTLQHNLFKSPEFCAACHKQFIDEEINKVGWVQLQNQYDNWRKSRWNHPGDPEKTIECRECHMPLTVSTDPASGDGLDYNRTPSDGRHRSHRFLAANQFMPLALKLPGAEEQAALTEQWLRGEYDIPEIAHKWKAGPAVPITIVAPESVRPGEPVAIQTVLVNNKVGHDFPTGPLDIIQAWVEVEVTDQAGRLVYRTGQRDSANFIAPGSFMLKAEPVDQYGNLIDKHNLWEMVGVRYRRSLFPGASDQADFTFACPGSAGPDPVRSPTGGSLLDRSLDVRPAAEVTELRVSARLMYRKADQFLLNFLFGSSSGLTAPVTIMSEAENTIRVASGD
ncbi:MAG TPA: multiheme c-type cytochrome [Gemmatimonadales bacterium]|nr:multiheme c-type cytochrome [Gemmatimonadales bacterium]